MLKERILKPVRYKLVQLFLKGAYLKPFSFHQTCDLVLVETF